MKWDDRVARGEQDTKEAARRRSQASANNIRIMNLQKQVAELTKQVAELTAEVKRLRHQPTLKHDYRPITPPPAPVMLKPGPLPPNAPPPAFGWKGNPT